MNVLNDRQLLLVERVAAFNGVERVCFSVPHIVANLNLILGKWRKRQIMNTDLVPWSANVFVFFVLGIAAKIVFDHRSAFVLLTYFFLWFGFFIDAPFKKTILTLSIVSVSVPLLRESSHASTMSSYLPSVLLISSGSFSLLRALDGSPYAPTDNYLFRLHRCLPPTVALPSTMNMDNWLRLLRRWGK